MCCNETNQKFLLFWLLFLSITFFIVMNIFEEFFIDRILDNINRKHITSHYHYDVYADLNIEIIDLSERGEVGRESESIDIVHSNGLSHRGVLMIVLDNKQENALFVRRSNHTVTCQNAWTTFGEHTKVGESYGDAALRGAVEELELETSSFKSIHPLSEDLDYFSIDYIDTGYGERKDRQWTQAYVLTLKHTQIFKDSRESDGYLWVPIHASPEWITQCSDLRCRSCTDMFNIEVSTKGVKRSFSKYGDLLASKFDILVRKLVSVTIASTLLNLL